MWRLIPILVIALACANAPGQGKVNFWNGYDHQFVLDDRSPLPASPLPNGYTLQAVLYAGQTAGNLALQTTVTLNASNMIGPGIMAPKSLVLTNVPGGTTAYFKIFITDVGRILPPTIVNNGRPNGGDAYRYEGTSGLFTATPSSNIAYASLVNPVYSQWPAGDLVVSECLDCIPPFFMINPSNVWVMVGSNVTLGAYATTVVRPNIYQWRKQGMPIFGATNYSLTLTNVTLSDSGSYDVTAVGLYGYTTSSVATVTVIVPAALGSASYNANNQFQFTVTGAPGTNYIVQVSTNLLSSQWTSVFTNSSPFTFTDTNTDSFPQKFYRAYFP